MIKFKRVTIALIVLISFLIVIFVLNLYTPTRSEVNVENTTDITGGAHFLFHDAEVVDVVSDYSLIVKVVNPRWLGDSNDIPLLEGDVIKVVWEDNDFIVEIITNVIEIGAQITFTRPNSGSETDFSQNPPVVPATGIAVYGEDGELIIDHTPF